MSLVTLISLLWSYGLPGVIPYPVELDRMTVAQARGNDGRLVCSTFIVSCPADTHGAVTVLGAGTDEVERAAVCRERRAGPGRHGRELGAADQAVHVVPSGLPGGSSNAS